MPLPHCAWGNNPYSPLSRKLGGPQSWSRRWREKSFVSEIFTVLGCHTLQIDSYYQCLGQPIGPTFKDQAIQEEFISLVVIRLIQQHKCSNIYLFIIYRTFYGQQFQPPSGNNTKTWKVKLIKLKKRTPTL